MDEPNSEFSVCFQGEDCTKVYNGKFKKVLKTGAKATIIGKQHQVLALTCNLDDDIMLNFIVTTPESEIQAKHFQLLWNIANKTEATLF